MDITAAIANLGFPIGLAILLLTRFESNQITNTKAINELKEVISGRDGVLDKIDDLIYMKKNGITKLPPKEELNV